MNFLLYISLKTFIIAFQENEIAANPPTESQDDTLKFVPKSVDENDWDVYVLSLLSENTAKWLILKRIADGDCIIFF